MKQIGIGEIIKHGSTPKGDMVCIEFTELASGEHTILFVPRQKEGQFLATYQAASLQAASQHGSIPSDEAMGAIKNDGFNLGIGPTGKVSLSLTVQSGAQLSLPISRDGLVQFVAMVNEALEYLDRGGSTRAQ